MDDPQFSFVLDILVFKKYFMDYLELRASHVGGNEVEC